MCIHAGFISGGGGRLLSPLVIDLPPPPRPDYGTKCLPPLEQNPNVNSVHVQLCTHVQSY